MKKIVVLVLMSWLAFSCGSEQKDLEKQQQELVEQKPHGLELNNGMKWKVDEGMLLSYNLIVKDVHEFKPTSLDDYHILSDKLYTHLKSLINSCTMTGVAHEELHKWLHPFIDDVKALEDVKTEQEGKQLLDKIKHELVVFNAFFE